MVQNNTFPMIENPGFLFSSVLFPKSRMFFVRKTHSWNPYPSPLSERSPTHPFIKFSFSDIARGCTLSWTSPTLLKITNQLKSLTGVHQERTNALKSDPLSLTDVSVSVVLYIYACLFVWVCMGMCGCVCERVHRRTFGLLKFWSIQISILLLNPK